MSQFVKLYPRNDVYNGVSRPPFQQASKNTEVKRVISMDGSSVSRLGHSAQSIKQNSEEIGMLNKKVEYLTQELQLVTQLLMEQDTKREVIEKLQRLQGENKGLIQNLGKCQEINIMLQNQLVMSEKSNKNLSSALEVASSQLQIMKKQMEVSSRKQIECGIHDSKTSVKSKEQVQQDIIRVNEQISNVLGKMHVLTHDYQSLRERNESLEKEKEEMNGKIGSLEEQLGEVLKVLEKEKADGEYSKQQIILLREEIKQVSQLSIRKQKEMKDSLYLRQKQLQQQLQNIKSTQIQQSYKIVNEKQIEAVQGAKLVEERNKRIKSLEMENQLLKNEIEVMEQKLAERDEKCRVMEREVGQMSQKMKQIDDGYRNTIAILQQNSQSHIKKLQQQLIQQKTTLQKIPQQQTSKQQLILVLSIKQQKIIELQYQLGELQKNKKLIVQLEDEIIKLKNYQLEKDVQYRQLEGRKGEVGRELELVRKKFGEVENQVRNTNEVREKYSIELENFKEKVKQLTKLSQEQSRHIKEIQGEHEMKKKIQNQISMISEITHNQKTIDLEHNNKQLERLLLNQKIDKDNQNKKYRELLEDYKHLNDEMSTQLQLYRDALNPEHPMCPTSLQQSQSRPIFDIKSSLNQSEFEREKERYRNLMEKHERYLERERGVDSKLRMVVEKMEKESQFLEVENSAMRAQIVQLNIRIGEYQSVMEDMKREADNRVYDAEQLKLSIQRQYEAKMEVQKTEIITQYNTLLRNREVRIDPTSFPKIPNFQNPPTTQFSFPNYQYPPINYFHNIRNNIDFSSTEHTIKYHPDYKKLQEEYLRMHRQLLQAEQLYNKSRIQDRDQIQKLRIENQHHRKTIDQLHAEGYGVNGDDQQYYRYKCEEGNKKYEKLYEEYLILKNKYVEDNQRQSNSFSFGVEKTKEILRVPSSTYIQQKYSQINKSQLQYLKQAIDRKLIQLQITPREPVSIIERAVFLIQKMSDLIAQLRQDREIWKNQKKDMSRISQKMKVRVQSLEFENGELLTQLKVMIEKYKYLQERNMKMANNSFSPKSPQFQRKVVPFMSEKKCEYSKQRDVYLHEANKIREDRLALLRKYNQQLQSLEYQQK